MSAFHRLLGRIKLQMQGKHHVAGWSMLPEEAVAFIRSRGKQVLTFLGYSGSGYEDEMGMLKIARGVLVGFEPGRTLVNMGVTSVGVGAIYSLAKSMKFETSGVVTTVALEYPEDVSNSVDHICFIKDKQWGGYLPGSGELSPTSRAMVDCSDILVAIGGNEVTRDELMEGRKLGTLIRYFPAEMNHEAALRRARHRGLPPPESFFGSMKDLNDD